MTQKKSFLLLSFLVLALLIAACSTGGNGDTTQGEELYESMCSSCHGPDAKGLEGKGVDLNNNKFIKENSDNELVTYVTEGRAVDDPLNTTGIEMPRKGGNPAMTTDQIRDIIDFLRTLQD